MNMKINPQGPLQGEFLKCVKKYNVFKRILRRGVGYMAS